MASSDFTAMSRNVSDPVRLYSASATATGEACGNFGAAESAMLVIEAEAHLVDQLIDCRRRSVDAALEEGAPENHVGARQTRRAPEARRWAAAPRRRRSRRRASLHPVSERGRRPAAEAMPGSDVRASIRIDANGDERVVDERDDGGVGEARSLHPIAVAAPGGCDGEEHWLPLRLRASKGSGAPRGPDDGGHGGNEPSIIMTGCSRCGMPLCWRSPSGLGGSPCWARSPLQPRSTSSPPAPPTARAAAGAVVGETLRRFHLAAYFCAAVVILSLAVRGVLGPRPRPFGIRVATAAIMIGATACSGLVLSPKITQSQQTLGVSPSTLPADDPRRAEFNRLHSRSVSLQLVPLLGGLVLLFWEMKD